MFLLTCCINQETKELLDIEELLSFDVSTLEDKESS